MIPCSRQETGRAGGSIPDEVSVAIRLPEPEFGVQRPRRRIVEHDLQAADGRALFSYNSDTTIQMTEFPEPYSHTDRNTLKRVGA